MPVPRWTPTARETDDLDLLVAEAFEPGLPGFADPTRGESVPVTLVVSAETAEVAVGAGSLELVDPEGVPLARLHVEGAWDAGEGNVGLAGPVERLAHNEFGPFRRLHVPPATLHASTPADLLLAVPVLRPLTETDLEAVRDAAARTGRTPLLLVCVGDGMPQDVSAPALVRATQAAAASLDDALVVAVPVADHGWAAEPNGTSPNDWLLDRVAAAYATRSHRLPRYGEGNLPGDVAAVVHRDRPPPHSQGLVVFFTGLSGSGKSTLARALVDHLLEQGERTVTSLDGDVVRHLLSKGLGFSPADRETNIVRIGFVAAEVSRHGGVAVCSPIAPFEATRAAVRRRVERAGGGFLLVHVATPLEECERRDRKGLYAKARAGEIPDFTGISSPYEEPAEALKVDTTDRDIADCLADVVDALVEHGWISR